MELKHVLGTKQLPMGTLALGAEGIRRAITTFEEAKRSDMANERLPPTKDPNADRKIKLPSRSPSPASGGRRPSMG